LTSLSSSAAWLVLLRAAATPARRRTGLLPGHASRNGSMTSAPPVAACGVTPGVARQNLDSRKRCRQGGGRTDGQLRCRRPARRCRRSCCSNPSAPLKAGSAGSPTAEQQVCGGEIGGAFSWLAGPGACHYRLRSVIRKGRCGPAHAVGAGCGVRRWCVPGPVPARSRRGSGRLAGARRYGGAAPGCVGCTDDVPLALPLPPGFSSHRAAPNQLTDQ